MAGEEQSQPLGNFVELVRGITYRSALLGKPGPILLGLATIARNGGFRSDNLRSYGGESPDRLILRPGDLYVSLKDVTQSADLLGAVARVPATVEAGRLTQDTVKLQLNRGANADLIYWTLRTPQYRQHCRAHATGTTNLALSRSDFLGFGIPPFTEERAALVRLLSTLERKIDSNHQLAATLEDMARALFKSWFVDFDPVQAKAEGHDTGLPADIAALFPDSFNDEGLPDGWNYEPLLRFANLISGGTPKTDNAAYWHGIIPWASAKDVSQCGQLFLHTTERSITKRGLDESSTKIVPANATVVVARGATTGRNCLLAIDMAMNQTCYALKSNEGFDYWFNLCFRNEITRIVASAHGSAFDTITTVTLRNSNIVPSSESIRRAFERQVAPLFQRVSAATNEAKQLQELRDHLLPNLFSGELRVADAEAVIAAA